MVRLMLGLPQARRRTTFGPWFHRSFLSSGLCEKAYFQVWRSALDWLESQQGFASAAILTIFYCLHLGIMYLKEKHRYETDLD